MLSRIRTAELEASVGLAPERPAWANWCKKRRCPGLETLLDPVEHYCPMHAGESCWHAMRTEEIPDA